MKLAMDKRTNNRSAMAMLNRYKLKLVRRWAFLVKTIHRRRFVIKAVIHMSAVTTKRLVETIGLIEKEAVDVVFPADEFSAPAVSSISARDDKQKQCRSTIHRMNSLN